MSTIRRTKRSKTAMVKFPFATKGTREHTEETEVKDIAGLPSTPQSQEELHWGLVWQPSPGRMAYELNCLLVSLVKEEDGKRELREVLSSAGVL